MIKTLNGLLKSSSYQRQVIFDLDSILLNEEKTPIQSIRMIDFEKIPDLPGDPDVSLEFESRFEGGNLRHATRVFKFSLVEWQNLLTFWSFILRLGPMSMTWCWTPM